MQISGRDSVRLSYTLPPAGAAERKEWVKDTLELSNAEVVQGNPEGWAAKQRKMAQSPFVFFRGSSTLYYLDLAERCPPAKDEPRLRLNGDIHPENFGTYTSARDHLIYDLNDFDETVKSGPFSWDVRRGVTGWMLAAGQAGHDEAKVGEAFYEGFREQIREFAKEGGEKSFRVDVKHSEGPVQDLLEEMSEKDPHQYVEKLTDDEEHFIADDNLIRKPDYCKVLDKKLDRELDDVALKTDAGTASLGLTRLFALQDDELLELKQELRSALDGVPFIVVGGGKDRAREVAAAATALPSEPYPELDSFLIAPSAVGAVAPRPGGSTSFLVRERPGLKAALELDELSEADMRSAARLQGQLVAAAMARQKVGKKKAAEVIYGFLKSNPEFGDQLQKDCAVSARQVRSDYRAFKASR